jgi:uncharacterized protein YdaU (DUF1376 family)
MNSPAFQFYPRQWLGDDKVLLMSWTARAMHMHFMCIAWQQEPACTLPDEDDLLQAWVNYPSEWEILKRQIFRAWKLKNGRWVQLGLLKEYEKQRTYSDIKRKAAGVRWKKERDARAIQVHGLCIDSAMHVQCSSSSSSTSVEDTNTFPSPGRDGANDPAPTKPTEPVESTAINRPEVTQADLPIPHVNGRSPDPRQAIPPPAAIPPTPKRDARTRLLPDQVEPFERSWAEYPRKDDKLGAQKKYAFAFETKEQREYFYSRVLAHKPYMESAEDRRFIPLMETFISKEKYKNLTPKEDQCQKRQTATMNTEARATVANGYEVPMK